MTRQAGSRQGARRRSPARWFRLAIRPASSSRARRGLAALLAAGGLTLASPALAADMVCDCPGVPAGFACTVTGAQGSGQVSFSCRNTPLGNRVEVTCQADESGLAWFCSRAVDGGAPQYLVAGLEDASTPRLLEDIELGCPCGWK